MLLRLNLSQFVLVATAEIEFSSGFTALTGETGAGKSILLDAISFVLGGRSDAGWVRHGQSRAEVSATFTASLACQQWLNHADFSPTLSPEEDTLMVRRIQLSEGGSRGYINGAPATATQLRELGEFLLDIHGQGAHHQLLKSTAQRALLDEVANNAAQRSAVKTAWQDLAVANVALETAQNAAHTLSTEREQLLWVDEELTQIAPVAGEWESIEAEHRRMANGAQLLNVSQGAVQALSESEEGDGAILSQIDRVLGALSPLVKLDEKLNDAVETLSTARIHLEESSHALQSYASQLDLDPEQLASLEARISVLHAAARKLRISPETLPEKWTATQARLAELAHATDLNALQAARDKAEMAYSAAASALTETRRESAENLGARVTEAMQGLALAGGQFAIQIEPCPASSVGTDAITMMVSTNQGAPLQPLSKVASGGELARISLAISVITSTHSHVPSLIFDEVDSGIGGAVADVVGKRMRELGAHHQVLAVTHLPQVAARAHQQFSVSKSVIDGQTQSQLQLLDGEQRVDEIARMLGGAEISLATRYHAQDMLGRALV